MELLSDFVKTLSSATRFSFLPKGRYAQASNEDRFLKTIWVEDSLPPHLQGYDNDTTVSTTATTAGASSVLPSEEGSAGKPTASAVDGDN